MSLSRASATPEACPLISFALSRAEGVACLAYPAQAMYLLRLLTAVRGTWQAELLARALVQGLGEVEARAPCRNHWFLFAVTNAIDITGDHQLFRALAKTAVPLPAAGPPLQKPPAFPTTSPPLVPPSGTPKVRLALVKGLEVE